MKNRAKCKLCKTVIESFHSTDLKMCHCGEIGVDGGLAMRCMANDFDNFMRVDDEGNEIIVTIIEKKKEIEITQTREVLSKKELIDMLAEMVKNIENLPPQAMPTSVTHYDLWSALALILSILKSERN